MQKRLLLMRLPFNYRVWAYQTGWNTKPGGIQCSPQSLHAQKRKGLAIAYTIFVPFPCPAWRSILCVYCLWCAAITGMCAAKNVPILAIPISRPYQSKLYILRLVTHTGPFTCKQYKGLVCIQSLKLIILRCPQH